jgi:PEP-CTERM motif-containing protein
VTHRQAFRLPPHYCRDAGRTRKLRLTFGEAELDPMKTLATLAAALAAAAILAPASARASVNLVTNGSFETGGFDDWDQFGDTGFTDVEFNDVRGILPTEGAWQAVLGPITEGGIRQDLATTIGGTYRLSFDLAREQVFDVGDQDHDANFFGVDFAGQHVAVCVHCASFDFETFSYDFQAFGRTTTLEFDLLNPPTYWHLDNISVRQVDPTRGGVPEPASWALMIMGFGAAGAALRARRRAAAV